MFFDDKQPSLELCNQQKLSWKRKILIGLIGVGVLCGAVEGYAGASAEKVSQKDKKALMLKEQKSVYQHNR